MRRALFLLGPVAASLGFFACDDSSGGDFDAGSFDAGGSFEASPGLDSAPPPLVDSGTDSPPPKPGVTVSLLRGTLLVPGIDVVFNDATGAVLETKQTGADGKATSTLAVASASILFGSGGNSRHIVTWTSVADGDTLVAFDDSTVDNVGSIVATPATMLTGATGYQAYVGECEGFATTSPFSVPMQRSCVRAKEAVLVSAFDANGGLLDYAFAKGQAAPPADAGAAASTLGAWAVPTTIELTAQNLPAQANAGYSLIEVANDLPFHNQTVLVGRVSTTFQVATSFADAYQFGVRVASSGSAQSVGARVAPAAATTVSYATTMPALASVTLTTTNATRPQLDWTTVGNVSLATAKGGVAVLAWSDQSENQFTWSLVVPPGSKGVIAPDMPTTLAAYQPHGAMGETPAVFYEPSSVTFADSDLITDYTAFRAAVGIAFTLDSRSSSDPQPLLPTIGKYELTSYQDLLR